MTRGAKLASYSLRFHEGRVRAVPETGLDGCPFRGPAVDLTGDAAMRAMRAAAPLGAWLEAREPGVGLRSVAVDRRALRVLITLEATEGARPRVLRFDPPHSVELIEAAAGVEDIVAEACEAALTRREELSRGSGV